MRKLIESEVRITQATLGVTLTLGVANQETKVAEFIVPDRSAYKVREGDILSVYFSDTTPTALADTSKVKLVHADPQGQVSIVLAEGDYIVMQEFQDRNKIFTIGQRINLLADDRLQLYVTGNLGAVTARTRFQLSAKRAIESII